ncbi:alpha/beta hydrolase [Streptomyces puniciscabiei]|uniref:alpha/beta hydrolase n=1 Tax=Streptomyces puniciscabiei TaxID=164348 RepID=UPI00332E3F1F
MTNPHGELIISLASGEWLACTFNAPPKPVGLAVICHGLTGDRVGPGGLLKDLAAALTAQGLAAIRFDARGCGDSSHPAEHPTVTSMAQDARTAADHGLAELSSSVPVIYCGISLGALAAASAAANDPLAHGLVAVSSDLSDGDQRPPPPRLIRGGEHELPTLFPRDLTTHKPLADLDFRRVSAVVVRGGLDKPIGNRAALTALGIDIHEIPDGDHLFQRAEPRAAMTRVVVANAARMIKLGTINVEQ